MSHALGLIEANFISCSSHLQNVLMVADKSNRHSLLICVSLSQISKCDIYLNVSVGSRESVTLTKNLPDASDFLEPQLLKTKAADCVSIQSLMITEALIFDFLFHSYLAATPCQEIDLVHSCSVS